MPLGDRHEGGEKRPPHLPGEGEVRLPVPRAQIVVEDPPDPARLAAVADHEILVRPRLEPRVVARVVRVAGGLQRRVEGRRVRRVLDRRVEVRAAAEPPGRRRPEHPRVHMHRRRPRRAHVRDEADPRGPEPRILRQPRDLPPRRQAPLRRLPEPPMHGRDVHPHLLEDAPPAHHRHHPAAGVLPRPPRLAPLEPPRRQPRERPRPLRLLEPLEGGADEVAQLGEPPRRADLLAVADRLRHARASLAPRSRISRAPAAKSSAARPAPGRAGYRGSPRWDGASPLGGEAASFLSGSAGGVEGGRRGPPSGHARAARAQGAREQVIGLRDRARECGRAALKAPIPRLGLERRQTWPRSKTPSGRSRG